MTQFQQNGSWQCVDRRPVRERSRRMLCAVLLWWGLLWLWSLYQFCSAATPSEILPAAPVGKSPEIISATPIAATSSPVSADDLSRRSGGNPPAERLVLESGDELFGHSLGLERGYLRWKLRNGQDLWVPLEWVKRMDSPYIPASASPVVPAQHGVVSVTPAAGNAINLDTDVTMDLPPGPDLDAAETPWSVAVPFYSTLQQGVTTATDGYAAVTDLASTWTRRLTLGGQFNDGNSQTELFNLQLDFEHSPPKQLRQFDLNGQIGRNRGVMSTNRWNFNTNFDWPLRDDDKWIGFATSKNEYDGLANLDYRGTYSSGVGYRFFNEPTKRLITRVGPGYTVEVFDDPGRHRETLDLFGEVEARWPVRKWISLEHKLRVNPSVMDWELVRIVSTNSLLLDLDDKNRWKLRLGFNYTYISQPSAGRLPADYISTLSLMYTRR